MSVSSFAFSTLRLIPCFAFSLCILASAVTYGQVTLNGGRVNEFFDYTAASFPAPLGGLGGVPGAPSHPNLAVENWNAVGGDPGGGTGDPFILRGSDVTFGPQVFIPDAGALNRSIGRSPQAGVGIAHRRIGNGINTNVEGNNMNNFRESWTKVDFEWNGGKAAFALSGEEFRADAFDPRIEHNGTGGEFGFGFAIENTGVLKASTWEFNGIAQDDPTGVQLVSGETYRAYLQVKTSNTVEDEVNVYVLTHDQMFDNGDPNTGNPQLVNVFDDAQISSHAEQVNNFSMINNLMLSMQASGSTNFDAITMAWLNGTTAGDFAETGARDAARQELIADRSPHLMLAWKASLGNPYVAGDVRLDGALSSIDIDTLRGQIGLGNTNSFYDLNTDLSVNTIDVDFLVQSIFNTDFGDVDLDGDVDAADEAVVTANQGLNSGAWADGDMNGDGVVDALDLAFFSTPVPGDTDGDGDVDLLDLDALGANFGTLTGATVAEGDFDGDGDVDLLDLDILGANFGTGVPSVSVPEPASILLMLGITALITGRRKI